MAKIQCLPDLKEVEISETELILEALRDSDIPITFVCGGNAQCSTCRVSIVEGLENCTPPTSREKVLSKKLGFPADIRLACQTGVTGDVMLRRLVIDNEDINIVENQLASGSIGEEKSAAILFAAIRGGADFDEVRFPYDIIYTMSRYFRRMNQVVSAYDGQTTNYMGNRFVAVFGLQESDRGAESAVARAVWAGLEMVQAVKEINAHFKTLSYQPLRISIGIHYGSVLSVAIANNSNTKQDSRTTILGDSVILSNRIESANREFGTELLVSEAVYRQVQAQAVVGQKAAINVSARIGNMDLFEITQMQGEAPPKSKLAAESASIPQLMKSFMQKFSSPWGKSK
jgi:adenylate cyclase